MTNSYGHFTLWVSVSDILKSEPSCISHNPRASFQRWQVWWGLQHGKCPHAATQSYICLYIHEYCILYIFVQVFIDLVDQHQEGYNSSSGTYGAASSLRQNGEHQTPDWIFFLSESPPPKAPLKIIFLAWNFLCDLIWVLWRILGGWKKIQFFGGALTKSIWRIVYWCFWTKY